ncbi:ABC-type sugar transport system, periplasmic component [Opitutaceae bacterium TAV1]|nr:ABC-type sugar transport system, periplasmic component [Opitutaceae bacterium TAV1]
MTRLPNTTHSLTHSLTARRAARSGPVGNGPGKQPFIKKLLSDSISEQPAHTRLPPMRELAGVLGVSLVTAQRAVTELVADGLLYSRPRAGVFVADATGKDDADETTEGPGNDAKQGGRRTKNRVHRGAAQSPFDSCFRFGTESVTAFQRPLWEQLVGQFGERYPHNRTEMVFVPDPEDSAHELDAYERLGWNVQWAGDEDHLLDLRNYAPAELAARCTPQGLLPLYYRTNYLFFNRELLQRCGVPAPAFRTFEGQLAYLRATAPLLERQGFDPRPVSVQQPVTLIGNHHLRLYLSSVGATESKAGKHTDAYKNFLAAAQAAMELCRQSRRGPGVKSPLSREGRESFMNGQAPFFLSYSVDAWLFTESKLSFPFEYVPSLCTDDSLFLWPMVGAINRWSRHPAECIRFLTYLLGPEAQSRFSRTGNFPASLNVGDSPAMPCDRAWLAKALAHSEPFHLPTPELFYLVINVLNNELWHALLDHVSVEEAVEQAVQLGRSYWRQHAPSAPDS